MKTVIISGGLKPSYNLIKNQLKEYSYLICADSGANCLYEYKICPNFIIGDLDSIDEKILNYYKNQDVDIIKYPPEKDYTDTEIAINKAIELGSKEIVLLGSTGSRMDHMLGNLGMLLKCLKLGIRATIKDDNNIVTMSDKTLRIKGQRGSMFSVIPYCGDIKKISIIGAKYPLKDYYMQVGSALGISNEFLDEEVEISFNSGILLIIYARD